MPKQIMKEAKAIKRLIYKPPLPRKTQRVFLKHQQPGKCKVYSEEEKLLYKLQHYPSSFKF